MGPSSATSTAAAAAAARAVGGLLRVASCSSSSSSSRTAGSDCIMSAWKHNTAPSLPRRTLDRRHFVTTSRAVAATAAAAAVGPRPALESVRSSLARSVLTPASVGLGLRPAQASWTARWQSSATSTTATASKDDKAQAREGAAAATVKTAAKASAPAAGADAASRSIVSRIWDRILSAASKAAASKDSKDGKAKDGTPPPSFPDMRRLFSLASPQRRRIIIALALLVISSAVTLSVPAVIGGLIDFFSKGSTTLYGMSFTTVAFLLLGVFLVGAVAKAGSNILLDLAGIEVIATLRKRSFRNVLRQDVEWADRGAGDVISRLSVDTTIVGESLTDNLGDGLRAAVTTVAAAGAMLYISAKLTLLMCCVVPPAAIGAVFYSRFIRDLTNKTQDAVGELSKTAEERISPPAFRTVTAFNTQQQEAKKFNEKVEDVVKLQTKEAMATGFFYSGTGLTGNIAILCLLSYGGHLVSRGEITVGDLTSLLLYTAYLGGGLASLTHFVTSLMRAIGAGARVFQLMDREPSIQLANTALRSASTAARIEASRPPRIELDHVSFAYPSRPTVPILRELNLNIEPGESVALVGPSGVGKSSVHSLLLRFYDPDSGTVRLDGRDIREMAPEDVRRLIGVVAQTPVLFEASLADNIAYGCEDGRKPTREAIERAARLANAYDFIMDLPQGFDTVIGPRQLSGGQMQRVAIARALVREPKILLLDEATSALDSRSESLINQSIDTIISEGRITVWIVAHRLSTIRSAARVLVLDGGKIVESGAFEELDRPGTRFRKLMAAQLEASGGESVGDAEAAEVQVSGEAESAESGRKEAAPATAA
ncbi:ATP-binding cassette permease mdl1 [Tilletia horrida]|uniref:ATP-binding cassette permease mdl1 n=1 Tax=Tilletia horrida TaxID=155126 RepID=A0AAN6GF27_9BASI|nr:ATP-binding cassette permease mdl1 [Tilletia horrida]KAK0540896.1 ATP-binding cassette permease mdl1 [Tilletia horrida]